MVTDSVSVLLTGVDCHALLLRTENSIASQINDSNEQKDFLTFSITFNALKTCTLIYNLTFIKIYCTSPQFSDCAACAAKGIKTEGYAVNS